MPELPKQNEDFSNDYYYEQYQFSDGKTIQYCTQQLQLNEGNGYTLAMISLVLAGKRKKEIIWKIYKSIVRNRLTYKYLVEKKGIDFFEQQIEDTPKWAEVAEYYRKAA